MNQRLLFYIIATLFFAISAWIVLRPGGHFVATQNLKDNNPTLSKLYPEGRLGAPVSVEGGGYTQTILEEPLYFNVRSPRSMDSAIITLWFSGPAPQDWSLGILSALDPSYKATSYAFQKIVPTSVRNDGQWQQLRMEFNLKEATLANGYYRFILSLPKYDVTTPPRLHKLMVEVTGSKLSPLDVLRKMVNLTDRCIFYGCR